VSLKYPPARMLDLDFLDSFRTPGDCGMEAGEVRTSLKAGSTFNLTWHLGYAHGGGYRLELVNPAEDLSLLLLPVGGGENSWETGVGKFAQSHAVQLPQGLECQECYLRFQRQALEWGKKYRFRSCADIKVVGVGEDYVYVREGERVHNVSMKVSVRMIRTVMAPRVRGSVWRWITPCSPRGSVSVVLGGTGHSARTGPGGRGQRPRNMSRKIILRRKWEIQCCYGGLMVMRWR